MLSQKWILQISPEDGTLKMSLRLGNVIVYYIKRELLQQAKNISELKQCGIYFLYGENENDGKVFRNVYVGQAVARQNGEGIWLRIKEHSAQKYWTDAIACVSADNSWGPTELSYLEHYFASRIFTAKHNSGTYRIENGNTPNPGRVTKEKEWELGHFIQEICTILEALRYDFFKEEKSEQPLFDLASQATESISAPPRPSPNKENSPRKENSKSKEEQPAELPSHKTMFKTSNNSSPSNQNHLPPKAIKLKAPPSTFSVSFPDGTIVQGNSAAETLALAINRIGPKRVAELPLRTGGVNLVSREGSFTYRNANYSLDDGYILCTHSSTDDKINKLEKISKLLNLGLVINKTQNP